MLGHRLRRWPNLKPQLFECIVFPGLRNVLLIVFSTLFLYFTFPVLFQMMQAMGSTLGNAFSAQQIRVNIKTIEMQVVIYFRLSVII